MASVVLAIGGGGALTSIETTVLLTVEETIEALERRRASATGRPGRRTMRLAPGEDGCS